MQVFRDERTLRPRGGAGQWDGVQDFTPRALAAKNLPEGKFQLTLTGQRLRVEWLPEEKDKGGKVVREVTVK